VLIHWITADNGLRYVSNESQNSDFGKVTWVQLQVGAGDPLIHQDRPLTENEHKIFNNTSFYNV